MSPIKEQATSTGEMLLQRWKDIQLAHPPSLSIVDPYKCVGDSLNLQRLPQIRKKMNTHSEKWLQKFSHQTPPLLLSLEELISTC